MPLTPEDVRKKTFTPVRLREGYDIAEVDAFLDEVETELTRLLQDNEQLHTVAEALGDTPAEPAGAPSREAAKAPAQAPVPPPATTAEAASRAARLLEIATTNADQLVAEAKDEADKLLSQARESAQRLESDARSKSERLEADARTRAEKLESETSERRHSMLGDLEREREELSRKMDDLRALEQSSRGRLRSYFQAQLEILDGGDVNGSGHLAATALSEPDTPRRLRELLGDA